MIADIRIINRPRYDEYRAVMRGAIQANGGRYIVRTSKVQVVEGNWAPPRLVVIEFPGAAAAQAFRASSEYAEARRVCANAAMVDMVLVEGVDPPPPALPDTGLPTYLISDTRIINPERFEEYRRAAASELAQYGGHYLARDGRIEVVEGAWQPVRLSMVEYPSRAVLDARLASDEYNRSRDLRANAAMVDRVMVEGWPPEAGL
ncbi:MAG: D-fructose-6-phosphate amidotransferase [Betaproteobacteria bacterium]|nr:D-fructose-6-phosphate amidotransferase [Betaproteobacteria bacterium]